MNKLSSYYLSLLDHIGESAPDIILWLVLFTVILVLYTLYLSRRISRESSKRALDVALESQKKSAETGRRIDELNHYLREVFSKEFGGAMKAFDSNVSSVLSEMKDELHRSVDNIERIESAVQNRHKIDLKAEEGRDTAQALLSGKNPV